MRALRIACAVLVAAWLAACGNDNVELTSFARDLVQNQTRDDNQPVEIEGIAFSDAENPNAFPAPFFL